MILNHPATFAFKHSAGGFGTLDTPTADQAKSRGPILLHTAIVFALGWTRFPPSECSSSPLFNQALVEKARTGGGGEHLFFRYPAKPGRSPAGP